MRSLTHPNDEEEKIMSIDVSWPGRTDESRIWGYSQICR